MLTSGASFWTVVPPMVKVPAGIFFNTILLGSVAFISSNISAAPSSSLQELKKINIPDTADINFNLLIFIYLLPYYHTLNLARSNSPKDS